MQRINDQEKKSIEKIITSILNNAMGDGEIEELDIVKLEVFGSRVYGTPKENSDLDIYVEYTDDIKEYIVFDMLNSLDLEYNGWVVDFFPKQVSI